MFDNLRRSIVVPAVLLGLALCWICSAGFAWSLFFLGAIALPVLLPSGESARAFPFHPGQLHAAVRKEAGRPRRHRTAPVFWPTGVNMSDAIIAPCYRLTVSRAQLLQWTTAAQAKAGHRPA